LFAANLQPSKGIEEALSAYLKLKVLDQTGIKFFIIGDGKPEYVDKLKSIAGEQMRNGNIQFFGYRDDIPRWMQRAKAVIVASEHEGFGRVAAEAMFNGSLVVGKKSAGTAELLEPWHGSQIALLFMDEESLVERMIEAAFMDGGRYTQTVLAAQQKAVECFSIEGNAEHVLEIYTRLVNLPEQPT
jgi:glycosyltransferase involved in cell wall biosynthesis